MRAVLFPGQGSQYVGMGSDFYKKFDSTKFFFEMVDKTLGFSLSNIILNGPEAELKLTQNTQPAIMTVGVCIFNVLNQEFGLNLNNTKFFAGHSLGEYTALVCAGSLSIEKAENIDAALIRYLTVRVKNHDLKKNYFEKKDFSTN